MNARQNWWLHTPKNLTLSLVSAERGSGLPSSSSSSSSGSGSRLHASRRTLLQGAAGLPLLLDLLRSPAAAEAAPAAAPAGLRYLTPAEKAAVDAAFAATLPKAKVSSLCLGPCLRGAVLGLRRRPSACRSQVGRKPPSHRALVAPSCPPPPLLLLSLPQGPVMLRLVFHDAATFDAAAGDGGLNASVRLELARPENTGLKRGWCAPFPSFFLTSMGGRERGA